MQQGKLNKLLQHKLDQFTQVPDEIDFNASAAWQKLEVRLKSETPAVMVKKVKMYKPILIAAVFISIIAFSFLFSDDKTVSIAKKETNKPATIGEKPLREMSVNEKLLSASAPIKKTLTSGNKKFVEPISTEKTQHKTDVLINEYPNEQSVNMDLVLKDEQLIAKEPAPALVAIAPKKKFRIVHVNETLPQRIDLAKNNNLPNTGFPFYKPIENVEAPLAETSPVEPDQLFRKKDRGLIKALTNSLKD